MVDGLDDFQVGELMRRKAVHLAGGDVAPTFVPDGKRHGKGDLAYNRLGHRTAERIADSRRKEKGTSLRAPCADRTLWRRLARTAIFRGSRSPIP